MKRLAIVVLFIGACGTERAAPPPKPTASPAPVEASLGCAAFKTYQTCNAQWGCMWAGLPLGCITRVE